MRIGLVYDAVYPWVKGGGEKHLWELAVALRARGHDVHCFGMQFWDGPSSVQRDGIWLHGVCRARPLYDRAGKRSRSQPLIFGWGLLRALFRAPAGQLDVIDSVAFPYFSVFAIAAWRSLTRRRTPWVMTWLEVWGTDYWKRYVGATLLAGVAAWIERCCAKFGDRHLCISRHQAARLSRLLRVGNERIVVIPRGLALSKVPSASKHRPRLLYIGRLLDYKNVEVLIRALPAVLARFPAAQLRIVGSGPELARLRATVEELQIQNVVEFEPPKADSAEVFKELNEAAILVQPSTREGQSLVVLEAQAAGTPVVAALHPESAVSDLIEDGQNGMLVSSWNEPQAWADVIARVLSDRDLAQRLATAGRDSARAFDWEAAIVPQIEELYASLTAARQRAEPGRRRTPAARDHRE